MSAALPLIRRLGKMSGPSREPRVGWEEQSLRVGQSGESQSTRSCETVSSSMPGRCLVHDARWDLTRS